jgi:hypothetical protein
LAFESIRQFANITDVVRAKDECIAAIVHAVQEFVDLAVAQFGTSIVDDEIPMWTRQCQDQCATAAAQLLVAQRQSTGANPFHVQLIDTLCNALRKAAKRGELIEFDSAGMQKSGPRSYVHLVRTHLDGGGALLAATLQFPEGQALGEFALTHVIRQAETEAAFAATAAAVARSEPMRQIYAQTPMLAKEDMQDVVAVMSEVIAEAVLLVQFQVQAEQCRRALVTDDNDRASIEAVFAAPATTSIFTYVLGGTQGAAAAARAKFASTTTIKPKAASAAKKYVGVLSSALDASPALSSRFISEAAAIGDTAATLIVDPGSEITVIDSDFLASLGGGVAQPALSVAPTQIAGWNNVPDGELHNAWLVAVRPQYCDEPHWVQMFEARIADCVPGQIIWGIDAAEQVGTCRHDVARGASDVLHTSGHVVDSGLGGGGAGRHGGACGGNVARSERARHRRPVQRR